MSKTKFFMTAAILATTSIATAAGACPCPDGPVSQEALAPVVQTADLATTTYQTSPTYQAAPTYQTQQSYQTQSVVAAPVQIESVPVTRENFSQAVTQQTPEFVQTAQTQSYGSGSKDTASASSPAAAYEALLGRRISKGAGDLNLFDYAGTKSSGDDKIVRAYIAHLTAQNPDTLSPAEATAYWSNLYNAETVRLIIDNYPVKSIRKIGGGLSGPWKKNTLVVNGQDISLNDIEHEILRKKYASPYIHYMVNCASIGCPNLSNKLWKASTLEADQKAAADAYINSPRGVTIKGNKLELSSIFKWFKGDFGGKAGLLPHIRKHAGPELAAAIDGGAKIGGYAYNWNLNE